MFCGGKVTKVVYMYDRCVSSMTLVVIVQSQVHHSIGLGVGMLYYCRIPLSL